MLACWESRIFPTCAHNNTCTDKCKIADKSHINDNIGILDILVSQLMVRAAINTETVYTSIPAEPMAELL